MFVLNELVGFGAGNSTPHRYWRALKTNSAVVGSWYTELYVKDAAGNAISVTSGMLSQSGLVSFNAANCVDGTTATQGFNTDSSPVNSYLKIDFGAGNEKDVHTWHLANNPGACFFTANIQYSDDDSTWTTVASGVDFGSSGAGEFGATW